MNTQVSSDGNENVRTFVLEGETTRSLMEGFLARVSQGAGQDIASSIGTNIDKVIGLVGSIPPRQVEEGEVDQLVDESKLLITAVGSNPAVIDDYIGTLNLCVVGLGSKVRGKIL